jgi:hypothetical protein
VNAPLTIRCARCGRSLETDEQRTNRLATIEQGRRDAERENANYPRLRRTGSFNLGRNVDTMSNQRFRRILFVVASIIAVTLILSIIH